ncbi:MAG: nitrous oxide reductase family maturation protein NosD [Gemmatimonadota bacterium]
MKTTTARSASRLIVLAAALALAALYFVPLWRITLEAPQFPEGLGLLIEIDNITGEHAHDLENINALNHYIGMKAIRPDSIPELRWMPWILAGLIGWGLMAAAIGRRWMICAWFGLLALAAVAGLVDFYLWGHDYGHNLDAERAIIKVPGMTYQPPLIGSKKLLNFTATSLPAIGGWIAIVAGLLVGWRCWWEHRARGAAGRAALVFLTSVVSLSVLSACADVPERTVDHAQADHSHSASPISGTGPTDGPTSRPAPEREHGTRMRLVVDRAGGDGEALRSIGAAVRAAAPGARILVRPGVYREPTVVVDRSVTIEGEGYPVIDGEGDRQLFTVTADGVRISGLDLRDVGVSYAEDRAAIRIEGASGCEIDHNRIRGGFFAIYLARATDCRVTHNEITGSGSTETDSGNGIHAWYSRDVVVESNRVRGHRDGIYFEFVEDGRVSRNEIAHNIRYGLHFMFSDGGRYDENRFTGNGAGVAVMYTDDIHLVDNLFEESRGSASFGLLLKDISDSRVTGNTFRGNSVGLYAEGFDRTVVEGNRFQENGRGLRLLSNSTGSSFRANDFIGNTFDVTTNSRRVRSSFHGNHWDGYRGFDLDDDGAGDLPHRPVRLFALVVERAPVTTILLRSFFVTFLDWTEALIPSLTPENLVDPAPAMRPVAGATAEAR